MVAAGSSYRPQVRYADKQTMTNPLPKPPPPPPPHPASPPGLRRQKFVNGFRDCRHTWDSSGFPNNRVTRQEGESRVGAWGWRSGRGRVLRQSYPGWNEHRCNFSQDKGPLCFWRNATVFCGCDATRTRRLSKEGASKAEWERNRMDGVR